MGERRADDIVAELRAEEAEVLNEVNDRNDRKRVLTLFCKLGRFLKTNVPFTLLSGLVALSGGKMYI